MLNSSLWPEGDMKMGGERHSLQFTTKKASEVGEREKKKRLERVLLQNHYPPSNPLYKLAGVGEW